MRICSCPAAAANVTGPPGSGNEDAGAATGLPPAPNATATGTPEANSTNGTVGGAVLNATNDAAAGGTNGTAGTASLALLS